MLPPPLYLHHHKPRLAEEICIYLAILAGWLALFSHSPLLACVHGIHIMYQELVPAVSNILGDGLLGLFGLLLSLFYGFLFPLKRDM